MISAATPLERLAQFIELEAIGDAEAGACAKHLDAGERLAFETASELLYIDPKASQRLCHVAHNAWPLIADDLQCDEPRRFFGLCRPAPIDRNAQAGGRKLRQR